MMMLQQIMLKIMEVMLIKMLDRLKIMEVMLIKMKEPDQQKAMVCKEDQEEWGHHKVFLLF